jgi:hypothetical protein
MRNERDPPSAAWNIYAYTGAPEHDIGRCFQLGCKTFRRRERDPDHDEGNEAESTFTDDTLTTERMWDVVPAGYDSHGNEISLTVFLTQSEDCVGRVAELEEQIRTEFVQSSPFLPPEAGVSDKTAEQLHHEYVAWYKSKVPEGEQKPAEVEDDPGFVTYEEHIAGPHCVADNHAYSGYQLSYEEMKACTTIQCLGPKTSEFMLGRDDTWEPLSDDEDFERTTDYCLSGLGDRPGAAEDDTPCYPQRHGAEDLMPGEYTGFRDGDLPFHPHCSEVYKRASLLHKGRIDIDGLATKFDEGELDDVPQHPAVRCARDQWWIHNHGDEFLVANPVHIPALRDIIERARRTHPAFNTENCAFEIDAAASLEREGDLFGRLPDELRDMIIQILGSKDIANLRQASSSFRKLPISLWYRLTREEMPWLWEAWCDRPYSFWACTTMQELETLDEALDARLHSLDGLPDAQREAQERIIAQERLESRKPTPAQQIDRQATDWHWFYREIKREWKNIKGLQNRERIWYAQAHIVQDSAESKAALEKLHADYAARDPRFEGEDSD